MPLSILNEFMVYVKMKPNLWGPGCGGMERDRIRSLEKGMSSARMVKAQRTASSNS